MSTFKPIQVGMSETKTQVGDSEGRVIGWMVTVTHPKKSGGFYELTTLKPIPEDQVDLVLRSFKREIQDKVARGKGIIRNDFISHVDYAKVKAA